MNGQEKSAPAVVAERPTNEAPRCGSEPAEPRAGTKPDGGRRPLAMAALEDKIVQRAAVAALNAIYEEDFLGFSYGFRPGRGPTTRSAFRHHVMDLWRRSLRRRSQVDRTA